jgi:hypothetical protein
MKIYINHRQTLVLFQIKLKEEEEEYKEEARLIQVDPKNSILHHSTPINH